VEVAILAGVGANAPVPTRRSSSSSPAAVWMLRVCSDIDARTNNFVVARSDFTANRLAYEPDLIWIQVCSAESFSALWHAAESGGAWFCLTIHSLLCTPAGSAMMKWPGDWRCFHYSAEATGNGTDPANAAFMTSAAPSMEQVPRTGSCKTVSFFPCCSGRGRSICSSGGFDPDLRTLG